MLLRISLPPGWPAFFLFTVSTDAVDGKSDGDDEAGSDASFMRILLGIRNHMHIDRQHWLHQARYLTCSEDTLAPPASAS